MQWNDACFIVYSKSSFSRFNLNYEVLASYINDYDHIILSFLNFPKFLSHYSYRSSPIVPLLLYKSGATMVMKIVEDNDGDGNADSKFIDNTLVSCYNS